MRNCIVFALLLGGFVFSAPDFLFSETKPGLDLSISLPKTAVQFDDLDMRDANNRKVSSPQLRQQMRRILVSHLYDMLMRNMTPTKKMYLILSAKTWDTFADWLRRRASSLVFDIKAWWNENKPTRPHLKISAFEKTGFESESRFSFVTARTSFLYQISYLVKTTFLLE